MGPGAKNTGGGPLTGYVVVELAGLGPVPFAAMLLADMGAEVIRVDRLGGTSIPVPGPTGVAVQDRGRKSIVVDLKHPGGAAVVRRITKTADVLLEGFRPGVAEGLGIGPDVMLRVNPRLIYGRMTGFGQSGPLAASAGHDLNYLAVAGALGAIGRADQPPTPPLSLLGDFAGGGLMLAYGVVCAILERGPDGAGQVIDAAVIDGVATLMAPYYAWAQAGGWAQERGTNVVDSGAPFYDCYRTQDGRWLAVAALESRFYQRFLEGLDLQSEELPDQWDRSGWPLLREAFTDAISLRTLDEWNEVFVGLDACVTPVLSLSEVPDHPHHVFRGSFVRVDDLIQPTPSPRFTRTPPEVPSGAPKPGAQTREILTEAGYQPAEITELIEQSAVAAAD